MAMALMFSMVPKGLKLVFVFSLDDHVRHHGGADDDDDDDAAVDVDVDVDDSDDDDDDDRGDDDADGSACPSSAGSARGAKINVVLAKIVFRGIHMVLAVCLSSSVLVRCFLFGHTDASR